MQLSDRGCFYNVFFFVSMLQASFLWAQPVAKDVCFGCHSVQGMQKIKDGKTISLQIEQERFEPSVHGAFECTACHSDITQIPHPSELKPVQCETCSC
jgi:hypothetical protein